MRDVPERPAEHRRQPCGCAQLPIQAAGQWAGTAQLAPAFSAAAAAHGRRTTLAHLRLQPRHRRRADPGERRRFPRRRPERRSLGSGCEPGELIDRRQWEGAAGRPSHPLPGMCTGTTLDEARAETSRGEVAMSDPHPVSVHLRRLLPLIAVVGLLAPGAALAAAPGARPAAGRRSTRARSAPIEHSVRAHRSR